KQTELLVDARDNAERLLAMIENLLALARLERGQAELRLEQAKPGDLLRAAAEAAAARADARHIKLSIEEAPDTPAVNVDPDRFGHALNNLLDNALTYTDEGGEVKLAALPAGPTHVTLSIGDSGIGIPPTYLPHVFERFFRVPTRSRGQGTGLGLAIVREIIAAHGGVITCASEPEKGTTFTITLPAPPAAA